jgi:hypothetical protein
MKATSTARSRHTALLLAMFLGALVLGWLLAGEPVAAAHLDSQRVPSSAQVREVKPGATLELQLRPKP